MVDRLSQEIVVASFCFYYISSKIILHHIACHAVEVVDIHVKPPRMIKQMDGCFFQTP